MKRQTQFGFIFVFLLALIVAIAACATINVGKTPKEQALYFLNTYNMEYDNTMAVMRNPNSTPTQIAIAQKKKAILTQMWPMLKSYTNIVDSGGKPTAEDTAQLNNFIDQLTAAATGGK